MNITIPSSSTEYVYAALEAPADVELGDQEVQLAIVARGTDVALADWLSAEWAIDDPSAVRILIGPGSSFGELEPGLYSVWVRVNTTTEKPVRKAGGLRVVATN